jgi:predicted HicB family RNase H-like nuclease
MVQVFTEEGFREEVYFEPFQPKASEAFIKKHGKEKTEEVCRQIMLRFKKADEITPAFNIEGRHGLTVDVEVRDKLKFVAEQRGLSINSLVREALHCHLLKNAEPVRHMSFKPKTALLYLSPFEERLLNRWKKENHCDFKIFLSTLASITQPLPEVDLVALRPRKALCLYPDPEFLETFLHSTRVYGYPAHSLFRQILAFMDRPFDPNRVQDRYLDWLTGGYAHALSRR